jgi:hypothetical protein
MKFSQVISYSCFFLASYLMMLSVWDYIVPHDKITDELEGIWEEAVMA